MNINRIPTGPRTPHLVHAIIEIPRGSRNKYEYDAELGVFRLDRVLYSSIHYPTAYGFIPQTLGGDSDPLDILVLTSEPTFTGCLVVARPIGLLGMTDEAGSDEKILAVSAADPLFEEMTELEDAPSHLLAEIEHFFGAYKAMEGTVVETFGWEGRREAERLIRESVTN